MSPAQKIAALALLAALGITLVSKSGSAVEKTFVYREIKVTLFEQSGGWYWQATPVKWPPKSFWTWIKWPLSGGVPFVSSQAASLDAIRVVDETVPFE